MPCDLIVDLSELQANACCRHVPIRQHCAQAWLAVRCTAAKGSLAVQVLADRVLAVRVLAVLVLIRSRPIDLSLIAMRDAIIWSISD